MDRATVDAWITDNLLDSDIWKRASETKQTVAVRQAERNLSRWYPGATLTVEIVAYQAVWELYGVDPVLKYQRHSVKTLQDSGETVTYKDGERSPVAPDVRSLLGPTADEIAEAEAESPPQFGGMLV